MIKLTVMHPNCSDPVINIEFFTNSSSAIISDLLGWSVLKAETHKGTPEEGNPEEPVAQVAISHQKIESIELLQESFIPDIEGVLAALSQFSKVQPLAQSIDINN